MPHIQLTDCPRSDSPVDEKLAPQSQLPTASRPPSTTKSCSNRSSRTVRASYLSKERSLDTEYKGPVIPPSTKERRKHRTLVLCFDGTGDQFDNDNSNVVNLFALLAKGESKQQLVYYQAGIGTYAMPQIATPISRRISKTFDMMLGSSLHHHVMGGYEFLMERYRTGDKICIFGFSRGAYTARALAGMIEKVGLLPSGNHQQVPFAYKMYMKDDEMGWKQSVLFKKTFSMDVDIEFVGVWDTVDSVGIIPRHVPFTKYNTCVKTFRHAIALDERRVKFKANLYDKAINEGAQNTDFSFTPISGHASWAKRKLLHALACICGPDSSAQKAEDAYTRASKLQDQYTDKTKQTDVLEVWFAGCHTDVGGGSVTNDTRNALARIPLRWMVRQCFLTNSGIQFNAEHLHEIGLDPHTLFPNVRERPPALPPSLLLKPDCLKTARKGVFRCHRCPKDGDDLSHGGSEGKPSMEQLERLGVQDLDEVMNEEHEDLHDALSPIYDQLKKRRMWWILEYIPLLHQIQQSDGGTVKVISINNGRPRVIKHQQENTIKVHRSVKTRVEAEHLHKPYSPKLKFDVEPTWVD